MIRLLLCLTVFSGFLFAQSECQALKKRGKYAAARDCYRGLVRSSDLAKQAEGYWGLGQLEDANVAFRRLYSMTGGKNPEVLVRWSLLLLEGSSSADAARTAEEALQLQPDYPPALLALARVAAESFNRSAVTFAEKAYEKDPRLLEAKELLAVLALEEGDRERAAKLAREAVNKSGEALEALTVLRALDLLDGKPGAEWQQRIAEVNPECAECANRLARLFVLNRRYIEGIEQYREAIRIRPEYWAARSELGINLMRVGRDEEARKHLVMCYENGFRNSATSNSLTLLDSYKNFEVIPRPRFVMRLHKKEAALLRPYVEREMTRNLDDFEKKYGLKLPGPVTVEMYPDHEDFAVRTMGMPGLGALGVTFVLSVAMDSPSARTPGSFHWAGTLRHELSHVFALAVTQHRVPRWFTEGVAVHEETSAEPEWGDRLTPDIIQAIAEKKLLPVAKLDRGFIRPAYPGQVVVSYFQAGRICDFIVEKHGWPKIMEMMRLFSGVASTERVVRESLKIEPEEFDRAFLNWLDQQHGNTVRAFKDWSAGMKGLSALMQARRWKEAVSEAQRMVGLYPDFTEPGNAYEVLARAHLELNNSAGATAALESYARNGGRSPEALKKLGGLYAEAGKRPEAIRSYARVNWIMPLNDEELHVRLGDLYLEEKRLPEAAVEYEAVIASRPVDKAAAHYRLARVLNEMGKLDEARDQVLASLEAAPGYRDAQRLLLRLEAAAGKKD